MTIHDDRLAILQFENQDGDFSLRAFNELALNDDVLQDGEILNMDQFKGMLSDLFQEAKPNAVQTNELWVNVPCEHLYTFVQDFSHKLEKLDLLSAMEKLVRQHSPVPLDELSLEHASIQAGHTLSCAVYASSKKWQKRLLKACAELGVTCINYIPEPLTFMALQKEPIEGNFCLFSLSGDKLFLSSFRNGLIYDCYFFSNFEDFAEEDWMACVSEFSKIQEDFMNSFDKKFNALCFAGFDKSHMKQIKKSFSDIGLQPIFLDGKESDATKLIPYQAENASLFGLFNLVKFGKKD